MGEAAQARGKCALCRERPGLSLRHSLLNNRGVLIWVCLAFFHNPWEIEATKSKGFSDAYHSVLITDLSLYPRTLQAFFLLL